ncbi:efflux RND transporter periplasmic adaptor subunit [Geobacter pelophilus]|jgi:HlyD family secretion protein|uniref:Efflux RND transporter periplasmic adaptor subunit n=1 Tax=Geoanaerobacter pelophilus TaxID=60036 RepID=A0AAW4L5F0_9BACT|nr:efflux RND transporter periplasmic adaptor subunit [Geoanaerobacter pelophilus]MBT0665387.1 efflux RND transporter periplasmic adaptor subunit [Geoanaerobacter pelophilus]
MKKAIICLVVLAILAAGGWYLASTRKPAVSYKTAKIERGTIVSTVAATGNLSAVTTVQVGTQVSGTIQKLYVDYNSRVKKGQTIAEIDPSLFNASVEQARGNALNAEANLLKAKVTLADAERTLNRNKKLLSDGIISQSDYDVAETATQSAKASLKAAEGSVAQTKGALQLARTNLRYSVIRSPVDGVVISRAVDVGQTVAASFQTPTLFTIAQDLTKMQIETSVDEADISRVLVGQKASFTVDAYPEQTFGGKVVQVRSAPVVTQNVVTYIVVVNVDNKDLKLKPGMTANVSIEVGRKDNVLKLPPAALRFKPKAKLDEAKDKKPGSSLQPGGKPGRKEKGQQVYTLKENKPVAVTIKTGIGNNSSIELLEGPLKEGDEVIVEQQGGDTKKKSGNAMGGSPMGPRPH